MGALTSGWCSVRSVLCALLKEPGLSFGEVTLMEEQGGQTAALFVFDLHVSDFGG